MPAPSSSILPSWESMLPSLLVLRCVHSQTPSLHLRTMMTTSSPSSSVQVLTGAPTTPIALPNTQLTATMPAHPLTAMTWSRLSAALSRQAAPSTSSPLLWRRVHLRSSLLQRSSGRRRPFCLRGLGKTVESDEGRSGGVWKRLWVSGDRSTPALRTWRLVAVRQGIRLGDDDVFLLASLRLGDDDADDNAEEDHQTSRAADDGTQLLVVDHPQLARVQWSLDLVAPAALRVQVQDDGLSDQVTSVVRAGNLVLLCNSLSQDMLV